MGHLWRKAKHTYSMVCIRYELWILVCVLINVWGLPLHRILSWVHCCACINALLFFPLSSLSTKHGVLIETSCSALPMFSWPFARSCTPSAVLQMEKISTSLLQRWCALNNCFLNELKHNSSGSDFYCAFCVQEEWVCKCVPVCAKAFLTWQF